MNSFFKHKTICNFITRSTCGGAYQSKCAASCAWRRGSARSSCSPRHSSGQWCICPWSASSSPGAEKIRNKSINNFLSVVILTRVANPQRLIRIRIHHFSNCGSRVLMTKNLKKFKAENFSCIFFWSKTAINYPSTKDAQATGEAFSPQREHPAIQNHEISLLFSSFVGHFCPPGSRSGSSNSN